MQPGTPPLSPSPTSFFSSSSPFELLMSCSSGTVKHPQLEHRIKRNREEGAGGWMKGGGGGGGGGSGGGGGGGERGGEEVI